MPVASARPDQNPKEMASQSGPEGPWPTGARWRVLGVKPGCGFPAGGGGAGPGEPGCGFSASCRGAADLGWPARARWGRLSIKTPMCTVLVKTFEKACDLREIETSSLTPHCNATACRACSRWPRAYESGVQWFVCCIVCSVPLCPVVSAVSR